MKFQFFDSKIFNAGSEAISHKGKLLIRKIAGDLSCYPETLIYIKENYGSSIASKLKAEDQLFLVEATLRDDDIDINRLDVDLSSPSEAQNPLKLGNTKVAPKNYLEFIIVPRV